MKRLTLALLILMLAAVTASPQKTPGKSVFGVSTGVSVPLDEFALKTFTWMQASPPPARTWRRNTSITVK